MLHRGIFRQWRRAIHMVEYFVSGVALSMLHRRIFWLLILDRGKFQKWHNVTSWNISPVASHHQCYIAEYFDVALSILNRGKFQKWHNKCYIAEYFINVVAVSIWRNISPVASHYQLHRRIFWRRIIDIKSREISKVA